MFRRKKKDKGAIVGGFAAGGMLIALLLGMGSGGSTGGSGKPVTAWMRNTNSGTLIIVKDADNGPNPVNLTGNTLMTSDNEEYRMTTFRTGRTYYVYGQEESNGISALEFGTIDDISGDGEVHPGNSEPFYVVVNGTTVGLTAVLPSSSLLQSAFTLIATIAFVEASTA